MFGLQPLHLLIIVVVALILFGPNQLPKIARALGKTLGEFRAATDEVKKPVEDAAQTVRDALSEQPLLVFVSSIINPACDDLVAERAAAKKAIEALPVARSWRFEDSPASPETAPRVYLRKVKECDIFVLVLGKEITYPVLREYATARKHSKPRLAFLKKCERTPATQSFVGKIGGEVKWKDFGAALDLEKQIQIAIVDLLLLKYREKFTANEIIMLTGLLSQLNKLIETAPQSAEAETPTPRVEVAQPESLRVEPSPPPRSDSFDLFQPTSKSGKDGKRMIFIPAGEFWRGTSNADILEMTIRFGWKSEWFDDEKPQREIYLDAYYIDETPVTNAEYKRFLVDNPFHRVPYGWDEAWKNFPSGKDDHPVVNVSWDDANDYARWAGKRLPTEAEWEKAASWDDARKEKRRYPWGNDFDSSRCNSSQSKIGGTTPVTEYARRGKSAYGVMDMAGNVWEWCADWYDANYYRNSPARNPRNDTPGSYRVVRGGSWFSIADYTRAADRDLVNPNYTWSNYGFRCVE